VTEAVWGQALGVVTSAPIRVDGKQLSRGGQRFHVRGVTYGTFKADDGVVPYPAPNVVAADFAAMHAAGFTVVRTYVEPPDHVLRAASDHGLSILTDCFYPDWRYLLGCSRRDIRRVAAEARSTVRAAARRLRGNNDILALSLGNEIPSDVIRFLGTKTISALLAELAEVVHEEDPDRLVTYANYPSAEYLPIDGLDFVLFNVFLERRSDFRRYLTHLQNLAGERPVVLGEFGLHVTGEPDGEAAQAESLAWQLETVIERGLAGGCVFSWTDDWWVGGKQVEGWRFGLTRADRSPRPALGVAAEWNRRTVADLDVRWPSITVAVCAYNAEATIGECLRHLCALDYPQMDIVVIDDGSTDATAEIAGRFERARVVTIEHAGLSAARNAAITAAEGELIAYLDSDAYPPEEWLWYLALGFDGAGVGGAGGPNFPPPDGRPGAEHVARAPGGPVQVLFSDDRAEHITGCNMAFWKDVLVDANGFDPVFTAAGDDVDMCWRVLDAGWEIGFHPAAFVWHHRRDGLRAYAKQQRGYGASEALVAARHPDRFTGFGTARWRGTIHDAFAARPFRQRIYRGAFGGAAFQSVYGGGGHAIDLLHQVGLPVAFLALLTAPLGLLHLALFLPAGLALALTATLFLVDALRTVPPRRWVRSRWRFRLAVARLHIVQPLVRTWGRLRRQQGAPRDTPTTVRLSQPLRRLPGGALLVAEEGHRPAFAAALLEEIRRRGVRVVSSRGWDDHDGRLHISLLLTAELLTSSHPPGFVQVRVRHRARSECIVLTALAVCLVPIVPIAAGAIALAAFADIGWGWWRMRRLIQQSLATASRATPETNHMPRIPVASRQRRDESVELVGSPAPARWRVR
jgi:glycosyltransferase involved in cell wall biosynthesis